MNASPEPNVAGDRLPSTPAALRRLIRRGEMVRPTAGMAPGFTQANLVVLGSDYADDFERFCRRNPRPCPLIERTAPGGYEAVQSAPGSDLRTDVPRYRVFRDGRAEPDEPTDVRDLWQEDLVAFLIGCSFTFEQALVAAGFAIRHLDQDCNVPMYRTSIECAAAGPFSGPMVVSMRPFPASQVDAVTQITGRYPAMHGAPIHVGDPAAIGIDDLMRPDFGDAVEIRADEIPLFWACGVTPQLAIAACAPPLAITHSPGCMFLTDLSDASFCTDAS